MKKLFSVGKLVSTLSLAEQFSLAKEGGFDGIDYILSLKDLWIKPHAVYEMSKSSGLPIYGIHVPLALIFMTPRSLYDKLFQTLEVFPDCRIFNLHLSCFLNPFQRNEEEIKIFITGAKKRGIDISFESNPTNRIFTFYPKETYDPEVFSAYCLANTIPMNFDTSHIASCGYDILSFFKKNYKGINLIHLSDYRLGVQHLPLGKGELPLQTLFTQMKQLSFKGSVVFELYKFPKPMTKEEKILSIKKSFDHLAKIC